MERVLVCILASTRGFDVGWESFERQVLDELNADLALAITFDETYDFANPYWQRATYRWTAPEPDDIGEAFDQTQGVLWQRQDVPPPDWRLLLRLQGIWLGGIRSANPQVSRAAHLLFCRWLLLQGLQRDGVLDRYDRFVVTRSDFVWLCPHPPMSVLDPDSVWIPDGQWFGGLTDRHLVVSRTDVAAALSLIDDILLRPAELYKEMKHGTYWNTERYLALHLARTGLLPRVKLFPYVMYTARSVGDDTPTWSPGRYEPSVGHKVKYEKEFLDARANAAVIKTRENWENLAWRAPHERPLTAPVRPTLWPARRLFRALWRPGRAARFGRFYRRTRQRLTDRRAAS